MYDLILFDLDGTLTNPEEGITKSVQYALKAFGIEEDNQEKLKLFIGPPLVDGFMQFYNMSRENALLAVQKYRERFSDIGIYENEMFEKVPQMLDALKRNGKKVALATSKPFIYAQRILKHFGIDKYFDIVVGAELDGTRNEKAEVIKEVLSRAKNYQSAVMVGDRKQDLIGAYKNNIPCIGVSFGFAPDGELEENGALEIADSISKLLEILLK